MLEDLRKISYTIAGETPSQKNSQTFNIHSKVMVKSPQFRAWSESARAQILKQGVPEKSYESARITVTFTHQDLRRRDGDNALASIQDLLVRCGVIVDDSWTRIGTPSVTHTVGQFAKCDITVIETKPTDWAKALREIKHPAKRGKLNLETISEQVW